MFQKIPIVLSIAGSDTCAGAGIQADLKTMSKFHVHGCTAITAITSQNTTGVKKVFPAHSEILKSQLDAIFSDIKIDAVKIGMLSTKENVIAVCDSLKKYKMKNVVLDTIFFSGTVIILLEKNALIVLKKNLVPLAEIITPNVPEAQILSGLKIRNENEMKIAAKKIFQLGCKSVLIKGGHLKNKNFSTDMFYDGIKFTEFKNKRTNKKFHGTGCVLSSAIASLIAKGYSVENSVGIAEKFVHKSIINNYKIGSGKNILKMF